MSVVAQSAKPTVVATGLDYDAIVVGAGMSGLYQLIKLRELGLRARVFEAGTGVGGAGIGTAILAAASIRRVIPYGFSFDKDLLKEWAGRSISRLSPRPSDIST